jgi:mxaD protein
MAFTSRFFLSLTFLLAAFGTASAHGPTPQKVDEKIDIAAPPATVWNVIKEFGDIGKWHPGVAKVVAQSGHADGVTRTITLKSGGDLVESLDDYDEKGMNYTYRLQTENVDAFPVSFYSDQITVQPSGSGSEVEWISRLYRADTTNEPPDDKNDAAAVKATTDFLKAGLAGIKAKAEGKG